MKWLHRLLACLHPSEVHLGAYADGELGALDSAGVCSHLQRCGRCRRVVESRQHALRLLRSMHDDAEEEAIAAMVAAGRLNLARRIGGEEPAPSLVGGMNARQAEAAGAIFGCRIPAGYADEHDGPSNAKDRRLDQMCLAILGSRLADPNAR